MSVYEIDVAIVGAGLSGLMAGRRLADSGIRVAIFESLSEVGGRTMTHTIGRGRADAGAQFFTVRTSVFGAFVEQWVKQGLVFEWSRGWSDGSAGDPIADRYPRYAVWGGFSNLAEYLASDLTIFRSFPVESLSIHDERWTVTGPKLMPAVRARAVLLSVPVPSALSILADGGVSLPEEERRILGPIRYHPCLCGLFEIDRGGKLPAIGAVQRPDENLSWVADNLRKGVSVVSRTITVHAGHIASQAHWSMDDGEILAWMRAAMSEWFPEDVRVTDARLVRWRFAVPLATHSERYLLSPIDPLLIFAGDAFNGPRVEGAVLSGLAAADVMLAKLS